MRRIYGNLKGISLIELMITVTLISVIFAAVWFVYNAALKAYYSQWSRAGIKAQTARAFVTMTNELHMATSITDAQAASLTFTADTNSDGAVETISYSWSGVVDDPLYRIKSSPTPAETSTLVYSVNSLAFSYCAAYSGTPLAFPITPSQVKLVAIDVASSDRGETFHLVTGVRLECI